MSLFNNYYPKYMDYYLFPLMHSAIWQSSSTSTNPKCMLNGARVPVNHSSINSTMRIFMLDDSQFY